MDDGHTAGGFLQEFSILQNASDPETLKEEQGACVSVHQKIVLCAPKLKRTEADVFFFRIFLCGKFKVLHRNDVRLPVRLSFRPATLFVIHRLLRNRRPKCGATWHTDPRSRNVCQRRVGALLNTSVHSPPRRTICLYMYTIRVDKTPHQQVIRLRSTPECWRWSLISTPTPR